MDLSSCSGVEGLQWFLGTRLSGGRDDAVRALSLGVVDTDLLLRCTRYMRTWPDDVIVSDWAVTLAEVYGTGSVLGTQYTAAWSALAVEVGHEIAKDAFTPDEDKAPGAIQDARILHRVLSDHPGLEAATARVLRARGVPAEAWPLWAGIGPRKADGNLTLEQARTLTDAGWLDGALLFLSPYVTGEERIKTYDAERTMAASAVGFDGKHDIDKWREAIGGKHRSAPSPETIDLMIEVRRQVPTKSRLAHYRMLGGTTPQKVLDLIRLGCTPDMAKKIYDEHKPTGHRSRREPMHDWMARNAISKALEDEIHEMEV